MPSSTFAMLQLTDGSVQATDPLESLTWAGSATSLILQCEEDKTEAKEGKVKNDGSVRMVRKM